MLVAKGLIKVRATHEVVTSRALEFAVIIVQRMAASGAPVPVLALALCFFFPG
jgi:hypothetical protein